MYDNHHMINSREEKNVFDDTKQQVIIESLCKVIH